MAKRRTTASVPTVDRSWEVRDALSTVRRAEEIKNDPKLMKQVKALATKEAQTLSKIGGRKK